ncbi:hypothetical protein BOTBODRAFT_54910 [Botryobasidium botryosum FD-172 SS1]|uniref:Dipeptidyl-peptidase V n=1 Tax=Botryobasidium botryosum (strain FD-172 SS1) TaxID=930990 RepID=A0A067MHK3_BOTB1|nr:hypothetical protein BOTBODRAFT_54910 [Botryobasidium botryosum FD-172 SS1]
MIQYITQTFVAWPLNSFSSSQGPAPAQVTRLPNPGFELKEAFAPRHLAEFPRPGAGAVNLAGDLVLVFISKRSERKEVRNDKFIYIAPLCSAAAPLELFILSDGKAFWLDSCTIVHATKVTALRTICCFCRIYYRERDGWPGPLVLAGKLPSIGITNFRYVASHILMLSAAIYAVTDINTAKEQDEARANRSTTALACDESYASHWDTCGHRGPVCVPLQGACHSEPVGPFGGSNDFDLSSIYIVYTTKDPSVNKALHTRQLVFTVSLKGGEKPTQLTSAKHGAVHGPVFNKQGNKIAWLQLDKDGYESDRAQAIIYDPEADVRYNLTPQRDRSPADPLLWWYVFFLDDKTLYFTTGDEAIIKIFSISIPATLKRKSPNDLEGLLPDPRVVSVALTHSHTAVAPRLPAAENDTRRHDEGIKMDRITAFASADLVGKNLDAGESFWVTGANKRKVQGRALKPKGKAIPLTINPAGSTTFGQEFVDVITEDWGGKPFAEFDHALKTWPEIDPERAAAAGASWGGYAINWIQGHPEFGFNLKVLVYYDGFNRDFGGSPWTVATTAAKWNPRAFVHKWSTPQLIFHRSRDFRLPETEGIAASHALQS